MDCVISHFVSRHFRHLRANQQSSCCAISDTKQYRWDLLETYDEPMYSKRILLLGLYSEHYRTSGDKTWV